MDTEFYEDDNNREQFDQVYIMQQHFRIGGIYLFS